MDTLFIRMEWVLAITAINYIYQEVSQPSVGRTRMINLPAELGWISKTMTLGPWAASSGLEPLGRYLLTHH